MKKIVIYIIIMILIKDCYSQQKNDTIMALRRFDIEEFRNLTDLDEFNEYYIMTEDGIKIQKIMLVSYNEELRKDEVSGYLERWRRPNSEYEKHYEYYLDGSLKLECQSLRGLGIGILKEYDQAGNLIYEEDSEKGYDCKMNMLIPILRSKLNIDLIQKDDNNIILHTEGIRIEDKRKCFYILIILDKNNVYLIDGDTGDILQKTKTSSKLISDLVKEYVEKHPKILKPVTQSNDTKHDEGTWGDAFRWLFNIKKK